MRVPLFLILAALAACGPRAAAIDDPVAPAEEAPPTEEAPTPPDEAAHDWPAHCPDPTSDDVRYQHDTWAERELCERVRFTCEEGWQHIGPADCGCGCQKDP